MSINRYQLKSTGTELKDFFSPAFFHEIDEKNDDKNARLKKLYDAESIYFNTWQTTQPDESKRQIRHFREDKEYKKFAQQIKNITESIQETIKKRAKESQEEETHCTFEISEEDLEPLAELADKLLDIDFVSDKEINGQPSEAEVMYSQGKKDLEELWYQLETAPLPLVKSVVNTHIKKQQGRSSSDLEVCASGVRQYIKSACDEFSNTFEALCHKLLLNLIKEQASVFMQQNPPFTWPDNEIHLNTSLVNYFYEAIGLVPAGKNKIIDKLALSPTDDNKICYSGTGHIEYRARFTKREADSFVKSISQSMLIRQLINSLVSHYKKELRLISSYDGASDFLNKLLKINLIQDQKEEKDEKRFEPWHRRHFGFYRLAESEEKIEEHFDKEYVKEHIKEYGIQKAITYLKQYSSDEKPYIKKLIDIYVALQNYPEFKLSELSESTRETYQILFNELINKTELRLMIFGEPAQPKNILQNKRIIELICNELLIHFSQNEGSRYLAKIIFNAKKNLLVDQKHLKIALDILKNKEINKKLIIELESFETTDSIFSRQELEDGIYVENDEDYAKRIEKLFPPKSQPSTLDKKSADKEQKRLAAYQKHVRFKVDESTVSDSPTDKKVESPSEFKEIKQESPAKKMIKIFVDTAKEEDIDPTQNKRYCALDDIMTITEVDDKKITKPVVERKKFDNNFQNDLFFIMLDGGHINHKIFFKINDTDSKATFYITPDAPELSWVEFSDKNRIQLLDYFKKLSRHDQMLLLKKLFIYSEYVPLSFIPTFFSKWTPYLKSPDRQETELLEIRNWKDIFPDIMIGEDDNCRIDILCNLALRNNLIAQKKLIQTLGIKYSSFEVKKNDILVMLFQKRPDLIQFLEKESLKNIIWDRELLLSCYHAGIRDFSGITLNNIDLSNADLRKANFEDATFNNVTFDKQSRLTHVNFNYAKFNNVIFPKTMFDINSRRTDDFKHTFNLTQTTKIILDQNTFISLYKAGERNFNNMILDNIDFRSINFDNDSISFAGSSLKNTNFSNKDLSHCSFSNANLENASLKNTILTYTWSEASSTEVVSEYGGGSSIQHRINTNFHGANLKNTCFTGAVIHPDIDLNNTIYNKFCSTYQLRKIIPYLAYQADTPLQTLQNLLKKEYLKNNGVKRFFTLSLGRHHVAEVKSILLKITNILRDEKNHNITITDIYKLLNPETIVTMTKNKGTLYSIFEFCFLYEEAYKKGVPATLPVPVELIRENKEEKFRIG